MFGFGICAARKYARVRRGPDNTGFAGAQANAPRSAAHCDGREPRPPVTVPSRKASNITCCNRLHSKGYLGLTQQFIGRPRFVTCIRIKDLAGFAWLTENPRVGGSIPSPATN